MAHIQDRWETLIDGRKVRTERYGQGRRWRARYRDPDGAERSKMFDRKQDAERFLANVTADVLRGAYVDPDAGRVTFGEFAEQWLEAQTFSEGTREATRASDSAARGTDPRSSRAAEHQAVGRPGVASRSPEGAGSDVCPSRANERLGRVQRRRRRRPHRPQPVQGQLRPTTEARPTEGGSVAARASAGGHRGSPWPLPGDGGGGGGCGLRQGEVFGLRVRDVDFLRKQLRVEQQVKIVRGRIVIDKPKGGRTRAVPLPEWVAVELTKHLRRFPACHDDLVFTSREHKPLNRNHVNGYVWRPALVAAGMEPGRGNGMHALRHFYASALIDAGESASAVAEYLGHADPGFTLRSTPTSFHRRRTVPAAPSTPSSAPEGTAFRDLPCSRSEPDRVHGPARASRTTVRWCSACHRIAVSSGRALRCRQQ